MKKIVKTLSLAFTMLIALNSSKANNLAVGVPSVAVGSQVITFTINWDNSWMTLAPNNWDAVWIYAKYQDCTNPTVWAPVQFSAVAGDHSVTGGILQVDPVSDGMGVFVRRIATGGPGNIAVATVSLTMTIPSPAGQTYNYKVFGCEMVRITPEDFQVGDAASTNTFLNNNITAAIEAAGILGATLGGGAMPASNIPAAYPMGWNDFYSMKYEITNEQYADFLNCLNYTQQQTRTAMWPNIGPGNFVMYNGINRNRNSIVINTSGVASTTPATYACNLNGNGTYNEAADGQNIPCAFLSWADLSAFLDWAGLRPMTDLEFEKICRGPIGRVAGEYVWGNVAITQQAVTWSGVNNSGLANETPPGSNCCFGWNNGCNVDNNTNGPYRAGSFAQAATTRISAGASYYGALEMGGNLWERIVSVNATGVTFNGTLGDGVLAANGDPNQATWPDPATALGTGLRGGSVLTAATTVRTSDRSSATTVVATRDCDKGGRGVRQILP